MGGPSEFLSLNTKVSKQIADDVSRGKWNEEESRRNRDTHRHSAVRVRPSVRPRGKERERERRTKKSKCDGRARDLPKISRDIRERANSEFHKTSEGKSTCPPSEFMR